VNDCRENEVELWGVGVGNLPLMMIGKKAKAAKEAILYIASLKGFVGIHPHYPEGNICMFKTENDAKGARNLMRAKGIETGKEIGKFYVDKRYVEDE
jgi:hypothetical protein